MKYFASAVLAGVVAAQTTVRVFEGLPSIDMTEPNVEAINTWAAGVEEADRAIDAQVVAAWDTYVAAVQAPVQEFLSELETAGNEKDKLAAQSLADMLKYAGDNTFVNGKDSLAQLYPAIGDAVDYLNAYDPAAPQPFVLAPAAYYNHRTGEYDVIQSCSDYNPCDYDYYCYHYGYEPSDESKNLTCGQTPEYTNYEGLYFNYATNRDEMVDPADPAYDPCDYDYWCFNQGDEPSDMLPKAPRKRSPQMQAIVDFLREKAQPYEQLKREYEQAVAAQFEADVMAAKEAVIEQIALNSQQAYDALDSAEEQDIANIRTAEEFLNTKIAEVAEESVSVISQARDEALAQNSSGFAEIDALLAKLESMKLPVPPPPAAPVVLQEQVAEDDTTTSVDPTMDVEEPSTLGKLKEKLAEKAEVYAELESEYQAAVKAQAESDAADAKAVLESKAAEVETALRNKIAEAYTFFDEQEQREADEINQAMDVATEYVQSGSTEAQDYVTQGADMAVAKTEEIYAKLDSLVAEIESMYFEDGTDDIYLSPDPPVIMQAMEETTEAATDDSAATSLKDKVMDVLEEKAAAYEELESQYKADLKAQFEADVAAAKEQLSAKLAELSSAIEDAAADLDDEPQSVSLRIAKKYPQKTVSLKRAAPKKPAKKTVSLAKKAPETTSEGSGYSAAVYGSIGLAAMLGIAAYAAQKSQKGVEPLIKTASDEEYQQA